MYFTATAQGGKTFTEKPQFGQSDW